MGVTGNDRPKYRGLEDVPLLMLKRHLMKRDPQWDILY